MLRKKGNPDVQKKNKHSRLQVIQVENTEDIG